MQNLFCDDYPSARQRFLDAAKMAKATITSYPCPLLGADGGPLSIDTATFGAKNPTTTLLITSGVHGVEGPLGSALQSQLLEHISKNPLNLNKTAITFVHAVNPYGFSFQRRANEDNVDLNRNFILPQDSFKGSPSLLKKVSWLGKPAAPNDNFFNIDLAILSALIRYGYPSLRDALIYGQYDYPKALFWGGNQVTWSARTIMDNVDHWAQGAPLILHLDLHSGLGKWAQCSYLTFERVKMHDEKHIQPKLEECLKGLANRLENSGTATGVMQDWLGHHFNGQGKTYTHLTLEFGTYDPISVFKALYQENRFQHHPSLRESAAKNKLKEIFIPSDPKWRHQCLKTGQDIFLKVINTCVDIH